MKSERNKAREKLVRELKHKNFIQRPFTPYEIFFVKDDEDVKDIKRNYKQLAALTHPDADGGEEHFKTIHWAYLILSKPECKKHTRHMQVRGGRRKVNSDRKLE